MHANSFSALFLDSGGGWTNGKEEAFILFKKPSFSFFSMGDTATVVLPDRRFNTSRSPLSLLEGYLSEGYIAIGYLGYGFSRFAQDGFALSHKKEGATLPDAYFHFYKKEDTVTGEIKNLKHLIQTPFLIRYSSDICGYDPAGFELASHHVVSRVEGPIPSPLAKLRINNVEGRGASGEPLAPLYSNMTEDEYIEMVRRAKEYIASGDVYQVNLSQRLTVGRDISPIPYFLNLYEVQPVPYGCFMDFGEFQLISGSMELFLRKIGRKVVTKPIKGTRKRAYAGEEDALLRAELVSSEKERAENLMIVDLMRNDLGRICKYGTVKVNELFQVESYATLHQLVSEVEGILQDEIKIKEIIGATFPPGSVTGAPKKRALEIIDELEPHSRGPYCGALGIFKPDGDLTLSVAIRILATGLKNRPVLSDAEGTFWVGGGIVWDSDPAIEYEETLIKARAIKRALGIVE